jgi:hypothetical protein
MPGGSSTFCRVDGRAQYSEGHLVSGKTGASVDPKPTAGKIGTQITVCSCGTGLTLGGGSVL